jgi:hypothetical protein
MYYQNGNWQYFTGPVQAAAQGQNPYTTGYRGMSGAAAGTLAPGASVEGTQSATGNGAIGAGAATGPAANGLDAAATVPGPRAPAAGSNGTRTNAGGTTDNNGGTRQPMPAGPGASTGTNGIDTAPNAGSTPGSTAGK